MVRGDAVMGRKAMRNVATWQPTWVSDDHVQDANNNKLQHTFPARLYVSPSISACSLCHGSWQMTPLLPNSQTSCKQLDSITII